MTSAYVLPYGLSGQWEVVRLDSQGRGKQRFFWREIAWRNVAQLYRAIISRNYVAQLVLKKRKQVERVRARRRRENYSEKRRQAEQERARMNRQRQREREIQRLIAPGHSDIYTTLSVIMSLFCCRSLCILISN